MTEMDARTDPTGEAPHTPVLYQEIMDALQPQSAKRYVDATVGAGGHGWGILNASAPEGQLLGFDLDPHALTLAGKRLEEFGSRATLVQASYTSLSQQLQKLGWQQVHGIVIDLGVSSMQVDTPERGFSFQADGPLDMRFDPTYPLKAEDLVNGWSERELADVLWRYGEEQQSRRIARAIVQARPLHSTHALAGVIEKAMGGRKGKHLHPATRSFQALRIVVNRELEAIEEFLPQAVQSLAVGGRLAVISFHSLEDRLAKQYFKHEIKDCICPPDQPICTCGHHASIREVNRHPITATEAEMQTNARSRSAKLRVVEKL